MDWILYLQAFILGVVEGVTEFLPISSTGHMIIVDSFFPMADRDFAKLFEVVIQLGAILSVVVYFRKQLFPETWDRAGFQGILPLWEKLVVAFLPAAVIRFFAHDFIEERLFNVPVVSAALVVWGVVLVLVDRDAKKGAKFDSIGTITWNVALLIGFAQCLAMVPGTSRSAATIVGAILLGCSRTCAAEFSFFLAIPTMLGASALSLLKGFGHMTGEQWIALLIGFVTAFLVAWGVIAFFMDYIKKRDFKLFGWYRIVLGAILLALWFKFVIGVPS